MISSSRYTWARRRDLGLGEAWRRGGNCWPRDGEGLTQVPVWMERRGLTPEFFRDFSVCVCGGVVTGDQTQGLEIAGL